MREVELVDFQHDAAEQLVDHLRKAQREVREDPAARQAVCLSAPTGAGKTVIMSAVIEAMLAGDGFDFDDGPAVLWITDSPELNEQSRLRLSSHIEAGWNDPVETIEASFDMASLPRGVWFLNTQKLGEAALLANPGDRRSHTFWQTVAATVERRPGDLVLVIDEAHRGMSLTRRARSESRSIVQRFIRGYRFGGKSGLDLPAVPLLVGVSATPQRFHDLLADLRAPRTVRRVDVQPEAAIGSGLLKQTIRLRHVEGRLGTAHTLLHEALQQHERFMDAWQRHCAGSVHEVEPVLLIQVQDADSGSGDASRTDLHAVVSTVRSALGSRLHAGGLAHAFQEPAGPLEAAGSQIRHLRPSQINGDEHVQVVLFKTALSTGWDCPRAEVMMSFRSARDETAIAQLVGRMVRAPLRREIPNSDLLNGVDLYLPMFDSDALDKVVARLRDDASDERTPSRAYVARTLSINPEVADDIEAIRAALADTPTYESAPRRRSSDARRLADIARRFERVASGAPPVLADASEIAREYLVDKIVALHQEHGNLRELRADAASILEVEQSTREVSVGSILEVERNSMEVGVDSAVPSDGSPESAAGRRLSISDRDLARQFDTLNAALGNGLMRRAFQELAASDDRDAAHRLLQAELLAMFRSGALDAAGTVQQYARSLMARWRADYRVCVEGLPDIEQARLEELFADPEATTRLRRSDPVLPDAINARTPATDAPEFERHVYTAGESSSVQLNLNGWEQQAVEGCLTDPAVVAWLRNERASGRWRLAVPYSIRGEDALMYPDLVLFRREADKLKVDVVDPHGLHLDDALAKLQGLARYAQQHRDGTTLGRVVAIAEVDGRRCQRDLSDPRASQDALACNDDTDAHRFFAPGSTQSAQVRYQPPLEDRDDPPAPPRRRLRVD